MLNTYSTTRHPSNRSLLTESMTYPSLFFRFVGMDPSPVRVGMPVNLKVIVIDIIDMPADQIYYTVLTKV